MSKTAIKPCTCKHPYQDAKYGPGKRVHNEVVNSKHGQWRCTVCGGERS